MSVQESLKQAAEEAKQATVNNTAVTVTQPSTPPARLSASDFLTTARTQVDAYLKVNENGLSIGKQDGPSIVESFKADIDLSKLKYCTQISFGKPVQYFKSYDGRRVSDGSGRTWNEVIAMAKSIDSSNKSNPYPTADVIMTVTEEVKDHKGRVVATPGTTLSYTPSYTGGDFLAKLLKEVENANGDINSSTVHVTVGFKSTTRNANTWGNVTWEFEGLAE